MTTTNGVLDLDVEDIAKQIGQPLDSWYGQCHAISLAIIRANIVEGRVARGWAKKVGSQHSWIAMGDPYDVDTVYVDPTIWCYQHGDPYLWVGSIKNGVHAPHGYGSIWTWGQPQSGDGEPITLQEPLSNEAASFLDLLGPMDRKAWHALLAIAPIGGWPAREIIEIALRDKRLSMYVPIDREGMLTDNNPGDLYW